MVEIYQGKEGGIEGGGMMVRMMKSREFKSHLNIDPTMHRLQFCLNFRTV